MIYINAFLIGGIICVIGQLLMDRTKLSPPHVLVIFVTMGVVLTAIGVYEPLVNVAGAGATIPLPGFGYTLAKGAIKGVNENGIIGAFFGGVKSTAGGIAAAVVFGYTMAIIFNPKTKP
ncbi:stage V sporulation protein AE [Serpentinicella sp. ANB-PHB4]|uniref:stage V sporulation protein AE n=1 Tax=Serpentinicella sp. ANB-PHB4 TaxID=3074076 RepID=UPI00285CC475|nr:stage V sporulation protein AE [Serpentinicella sp. ANB-PHB4]MDR5660062.1 stage V sporulation protein AE [Serpentinicella sp. ANB-PHB4]